MEFNPPDAEEFHILEWKICILLAPCLSRPGGNFLQKLNGVDPVRALRRPGVG